MAVIQNEIAQYANWYHRIEVSRGIFTPGTHDSQHQLAFMDAEVGFPKNCSGMRILDLGVRDGFFSFEMERRGAREVVGVDYVPPDKTGFHIASKLLGSKVQYVTDNVYNISKAKYGTFDIVLFLGILYHLRNPIYVMDRLREVTNDGGLLFVETQMATDPSVDKLVTPAWQYFPSDSFNNDGSNKWAPNLAAMKAMASDCLYEPLIAKPYFTRGYLTAKATSNEKNEHFKKADYSIGMWG